MMNDGKRQIQIDRMVDGELTVDEQQELLRNCQRHESWRDLALAYVESQAWRDELSSMLQEHRREPNYVEGRNREVPSAYGSPWALAVAILVSLGVGYGLGWSWPTAPAASRDGMRVAESESLQSRDPEEAGRLASIPLVVSDPTLDRLQQVQLPIVRASELRPDWLQQLRSGLPPELTEEMQGNGLHVSRTRVFAPVELGDGKRVVVPIEYYVEREYQ